MVGQKSVPASGLGVAHQVSILFLMDGGPEEVRPAADSEAYLVSILFLMDGGPEDHHHISRQVQNTLFQSFS